MRHHYLPIFYTKRWALADDGRLCEFSRPFGRVVKPRRVHPAGTGYVDGLYGMRGLSPSLIDQFESLFLSPVDSKAADALSILEQNDPPHVWTSDERSAWTRFILTLVMRMPSDVADLKQIVADDWSKPDANIEEQYRQMKSDTDPPTIREWLAANDPNFVENSSFQIALSLMDHASIGRDINNFIWQVRNTVGARYELLTSDRPVVHTESLGGANAALVVPIGPRRAFIATRTKELTAEFRRLEVNELTSMVNEEVVQGANRYVLGSNDRQLRYVQNRLGTAPKRGWFARVRDVRNRR